MISTAKSVTYLDRQPAARQFLPVQAGVATFSAGRGPSDSPGILQTLR
jgi:hypothetical protein